MEKVPAGLHAGAPRHPARASIIEELFKKPL
jgi:hypothetical protein